jgi:hypothetical protein
MLLSEGYTMYFGPAKNAPAYFDSLGYGYVLCLQPNQPCVESAGCAQVSTWV